MVLPANGRHTTVTTHHVHPGRDSGRDSASDSGSVNSARSDELPLMARKHSVLHTIGSYVKDFFEQSTLHGLRYMILDKGNYVEV